MLIQKVLIYWSIWILYREVWKGIKRTGFVYTAVKFNDRLKMEMSQQMGFYREKLLYRFLY